MERVICLIGPTASGKTDVALKLAKGIGAEIISCDSMQVYKEFDIASSKPTKSQRKNITHHLIDVVRPSQQYNAARFRTSCQKTIRDIHKRGRLPLIVAGTGLYLRALLDGLFSGPGQNASLRHKFYQQAKKYGKAYLYKQLKSKDPQAALTIHPHDSRRIIRALEVYQKTGVPLSKLRQNTFGIRDKYDLRIFGLKRPRAQLYERIEKRVDQMFRRGLVAEIKKITRGKISKTAKSLLGYKEVVGLLNGEYSAAQARELLKRNTRRYAKRQISWFKRERAVKWITVTQKDSAESVSEKILRELGDVGDRQR